MAIYISVRYRRRHLGWHPSPGVLGEIRLGVVPESLQETRRAVLLPETLPACPGSALGSITLLLETQGSRWAGGRH